MSRLLRIPSHVRQHLLVPSFRGQLPPCGPSTPMRQAKVMLTVPWDHPRKRSTLTPPVVTQKAYQAQTRANYVVGVGICQPIVLSVLRATQRAMRATPSQHLNHVYWLVASHFPHTCYHDTTAPSIDDQIDLGTNVVSLYAEVRTGIFFVRGRLHATHAERAASLLVDGLRRTSPTCAELRRSPFTRRRVQMSINYSSQQRPPTPMQLMQMMAVSAV